MSSICTVDLIFSLVFSHRLVLVFTWWLEIIWFSDPDADRDGDIDFRSLVIFQPHSSFPVSAAPPAAILPEVVASATMGTGVCM